METEKKKTTASSGVSFKTSVENKLKLEQEAHNLGLTLSEYIKLLLEETPNRQGASSNVKQGGEKVEKSEIPDNNVYLREFADKQDAVVDLLQKLVELQQPAADAQSYTGDEINQMLADAITQEEERLRGEYLMLKMTVEQKNVIQKLLAWRQENKEKFCASIEELFFFLVKEKFCGFLSSNKPEDFEVEFKKAFEGYFNA